MKKLSQVEFIAKALVKSPRPVDLSSFVYTGSAGRSTAICEKHGAFQISANALMNGTGCPKCAVISRVEKRRMPLGDFLTRATETHGDRYDYSRVTSLTNSNTKVEIVCTHHGAFLQTPASHLSGRGCPTCFAESVSARTRMSQAAYIERVLEKHGDVYDLSRVTYTRSSDKIEVVCHTHGSFFPTAGNFLFVGSGCPTCARERVGVLSRKPLANYVAAGAVTHKGRFGYRGVKYSNNAAHLRLSCPEHGEFEQLARSHITGSGCPLCAKPVHDLPSFILHATEKHAGKYNYSGVKYTKALTKVEIGCPTHGMFWQTPNMHVNEGQGCPRCARTGPSVGQLELLDFLRTHTTVVDRYKIGRKEVDVFLPEFNIGVEYHGLIWHSTRFSKTPTEDFKKHKLFAKHGIRIIHIYEDEWADRRQRVERLLLSAIGKSSGDRVFARCLSVRDVSTADAESFYDEHHVQGGIGTVCLNYGLYQGGVLVAAMSFSRLTSLRGTVRRKDEYELRRFATAKGVVGGASKLLTHFLRLTPDVARIVSYSDNRLFDGRTYERLGFSKDYVSAPSYCYVTSRSEVGRLPKTAFKRSALPRIPGFVFDPLLSERENCEANGYYQLHDCGKTRWVLVR